MLDTSFSPVRRDYVFDEKCHACPRKLTSNVAIILRDVHGREFPFGPKCAKDALGPEGQRLLRHVPDFTKAALGQEREGTVDGGAGGAGNSGVRDADETARQFRRAVTYLLLRQQKLAHVPAAGYGPFSTYADTLEQTGTLPEDAVAHILNVERKNIGTKFGFDNLQAVYGYDRCIERTLASVKPEKQDWLKDIHASLRNCLYLTEAQARGVGNWFERIPGHQPLSPQGFQWTWRTN